MFRCAVVSVSHYSQSKSSSIPATLHQHDHNKLPELTVDVLLCYFMLSDDLEGEGGFSTCFHVLDPVFQIRFFMFSR